MIIIMIMMTTMTMMTTTKMMLMIMIMMMVMMMMMMMTTTTMMTTVIMIMKYHLSINCFSFMHIKDRTSLCNRISYLKQLTNPSNFLSQSIRTPQSLSSQAWTSSPMPSLPGLPYQPPVALTSGAQGG